MLPEDLSADDIAAGRLVRVLTDGTAHPGLRPYYPSQRHTPAKLRVLIDLIREKTARRQGRGVTLLIISIRNQLMRIAARRRT